MNIGHELFTTGEPSDTMYFVVCGIFSYKEEAGLQIPYFLAERQWFCEPVFWITWKHTGQMLATTHCELIALNSAKAQDVFMQSGDCQEVKRYARYWVRYMRKNPDHLTDVWAEI